ncbi:hypothetical protein MKW98_009793 [Papaver atlanticum]|uniref:Uncharacterized protein n=1 Tax=Papaver atlanticum TaxID=357466 RepID=A0AAD4SX48_9MAGN|nr:hypothetical protein MKW98_009793 [Papaver atlanticum]
MEVQVISKEIIKPSTPTPPHLRNFKISLIDQLLLPVYNPVVIFFPANDVHEPDNNNNDYSSKTKILKKSLSETLARFYPMAGRLKDNISIECNDEGIDYIEAKVNAMMSEFMNVDVVHQLHPSHIIAENVAKQAQMAVQVNLFDCGGIAISLCVSHKIIDGSSAVTFMRSWSVTARAAINQEEEVLYPTFDSAAIFPALPPGVQVSSLESYDSIRGENVVTKLFLFNASKIAALRARVAESRSSNMLSRYPTRTEAISALVWKSFMEANRVNVTRKHKLFSTKPIIIRSKANFSVNLREKLNPPLPNESFGNIITTAAAESTIIDNDEDTLGFVDTLDGLISRLRLGVSGINDEYIRKFQEGDVEFLKELVDHEGNENEEEKVHICWISSLCRYPFYELDFGWGKPLWFALNTFSEYKNSVSLVGTKCGTGIEAWVSLEKEDMAVFEEDQDLLQYAKNINTPDPVVGFVEYPFLGQGNRKKEPVSRL